MDTDVFGFGIKFYGRSDTRADGSYIATRWIVLAYIPVVPLGSFLVHPLHKRLKTTSTNLPPLTARVKWQKQHIFNVYAFMAAIAVALLTINYHAKGPSSATAAIPARIKKGKALPPNRTNPDYARPTAAENGSPFPSFSSYIEGYEQLANEGYAQITVNNEQNTSDLYAKLYVLDREIATPVRVFFVKAEDYFIVSNLDAGDYELRYQDLDTGGIAKTERLPLERKEKEGGFVFTHGELTLSKVINGNLQTEPISEEDF